MSNLNKILLTIFLVYFCSYSFVSICQEKNDILYIQMYDNTLYKNIESYFEKTLELHHSIDSFLVQFNEHVPNQIDTIFFISSEKIQFSYYQVSSSRKKMLMELYSNDENILKNLWTNYALFKISSSKQKLPNYTKIHIHVEGYILILILDENFLFKEFMVANLFI